MNDVKTTDEHKRRMTARRAAIASFVGTTIEWYDFFLYGTAAALIFGPLFFPSESEFVSTLLSFASFSVAFVARPLGGLVFGWIGDRLGRKPALITTLSMMGIGTGAIGLLPTYESVGVLAPVLLVACRVIQGIAIGGEYGGAVLMAVEHADPARKSWYGSWVQAGSPMGLIMCNSIFLVATHQLAESTFAWRVPFLVSFILIAIGLYVRSHIEETPEFEISRETAGEKNPIAGAFKKSKLKIVLVALAYAGAGVTVYVVAVYSMNLGTARFDWTMDDVLLFVILGQVVAFFGMLFFGKLGDRIPYQRIFIYGCVFMGGLAFLWMHAFASGSWLYSAGAFLLMSVPYAAVYGSMAVFFARTFEADHGYTGLSLGYQIGTVISSAVAPIIALNLLEWTESVMSIVLYMFITCLVSGGAGFALYRVSQKEELRRRTTADHNLT